MLTALEDRAAAGRPVSAWRPVLDGTACRLRVRGARARVAAACVSVIAAAALAAGVSWVTWQATMAPWPSIDEARVLAQPVLPPGEPSWATRHDDVLVTWGVPADRVPSLLPDGPQMPRGGVELVYDWRPTQRQSDAESSLRQAQQQARAAGCVLVDEQRSGFSAHRDGMFLSYMTVVGHTNVSVTPQAPAAAFRWGWAGAAIGALLGWLAAAALIARYRRVSPAVAVLTQLAIIFGVCLSLPAAGLSLLALVTGELPWGDYEFFMSRQGAVAGALILAAAWLLTIVAKGGEVSAAVPG